MGLIKFFKNRKKKDIFQKRKVTGKEKKTSKFFNLILLQLLLKQNEIKLKLLIVLLSHLRI